jgi:hypothetical protein
MALAYRGVPGIVGSEQTTSVRLDNRTEAELDDSAPLVKSVKSSWIQKLSADQPSPTKMSSLHTVLTLSSLLFSFASSSQPCSSPHPLRHHLPLPYDHPPMSSMSLLVKVLRGCGQTIPQRQAIICTQTCPRQHLTCLRKWKRA